MMPLLLLASILFYMQEGSCNDLTDFYSDSFSYEDDNNAQVKNNMPVNVTNILASTLHQNIRLHCGNKTYPGEVNSAWYFQACGYGLNETDCEEFLNTKWEGRKLCGTANLPTCKLSIQINKPQRQHSGLYKCYILQGKAGYVINATLASVTHLEVADSSVKDLVTVIGPENKTAVVNSMSKLTCKVFSNLPVLVKWFKLISLSLKGKNQNKNVIEYNNNYYQEVPTYNTSRASPKQFVSTLFFNSVKLSDTGKYVCIVIGSFDMKMKAGSLTVTTVPTEMGFNTQDKIIGYTVLSVCLLLFSLIWCCGMACANSLGKESSTPPRQSPPPTPVRHVEMRSLYPEHDNQDTSDYEHVVIL